MPNRRRAACASRRGGRVRERAGRRLGWGGETKWRLPAEGGVRGAGAKPGSGSALGAAGSWPCP